MKKGFRDFYNIVFYTKSGLAFALYSIFVTLGLLGLGLDFFDKFARKGYMWAKTATIILLSLTVLLLLIAVLCIILKYIYFPIRYKITSKEYLAEAFELMRVREGKKSQYGVKCRFRDEEGLEIEKIAIVKFSVYNELDKTEPAQFETTEEVKVDSIYPPVGVLAVFGKYGKEEVFKIREVGLDLT